METLSLRQTRQICLFQQGFSQRQIGASAVNHQVQHLGYVQIDAISVIERAHHHVLWSRIEDYQSDWLNQSLESRDIFEYWGHAASYLPMTDYRYYRQRMLEFSQNNRWAQSRLAQYGHLLPEIKARLAQSGPLSTRHFEDPHHRGSGWWHWKPAKVALELLYWQGDVMVSRRDGFDKVYDLTERVLPQKLNLEIPSLEERADFCVRRALQSLGSVTLKEMSKHLPLVPLSALQAALLRQLEAKTVQIIQVEKQNKPEYILSTHLQQLSDLPENKQVNLLSPFDNLLIQRQRFQRLFGGDYCFEAYVPASKRRYGYFTLVLMRGERLLAYVDCKAFRAEQVLAIQKVTWVNALRRGDKTAIDKEFSRFANLNGCKSVIGLF